MTHNQLVADNRTGIAVTFCPGHATDLESFEDRRMGAAGWQISCVTIYRCEACGTRIVVERTADPEADLVQLEPRLLNVYDWSEPRDLVERLGRSLAMPRANGSKGS